MNWGNTVEGPPISPIHENVFAGGTVKRETGSRPSLAQTLMTQSSLTGNEALFSSRFPLEPTSPTAVSSQPAPLEVNR